MEVIDILQNLVERPSYPGILAQETEVAKYIKSVFDKENIECKLFEVEDGRCNVVAWLNGNKDGKTILLTGHTDTVDPYNMEKPFELVEKDGKLFGRGAVDMKGALAAMMQAIIEIKRQNTNLNGNVIFAGVIDEEYKSLGTIDLIEQNFCIDMAIVGEPSKLELCIAHRGLEWFEIDFHGKTVHGGSQAQGINAIEKAGKFINKVETDLQAKLMQRTHPVAQNSTMNYGTINGGDQPSTVAGSCKLTFDRRWVPGETYDSVVKEYQQILIDLSKEDPSFDATLKVMDVSVMKKGYTHEPMEIGKEHDLVKIIEKSYKQVTGEDVNHTFFPAWSDGGLLHTFGKIPTVVFGPGDLKSAHSSEEYMDRNQLIKSVEIYKAIIENI